MTLPLYSTRGVPARELAGLATGTVPGVTPPVRGIVSVTLRADDDALALALGAEAEIGRHRWRGALGDYARIVAYADVRTAGASGDVVRLKWATVADPADEDWQDFTPACEVAVSALGTFVSLVASTIPAGALAVPTVVVAAFAAGSGSPALGNVGFHASNATDPVCHSALPPVYLQADDFCQDVTAAGLVARVGANATPTDPNYSLYGLLYNQGSPGDPVNFTVVLDDAFNGGHHAVEQVQHADASDPASESLYIQNRVIPTDVHDVTVSATLRFSSGFRPTGYFYPVQAYGVLFGGAASPYGVGFYVNHGASPMLQVRLETDAGVYETVDVGPWATYADGDAWTFKVRVYDLGDGQWRALAWVYRASGGGLVAAAADATRPNTGGPFTAQDYLIGENSNATAPAADQRYRIIEWAMQRDAFVSL